MTTIGQLVSEAMAQKTDKTYTLKGAKAILPLAQPIARDVLRALNDDEKAAGFERYIDELNALGIDLYQKCGRSMLIFPSKRKGRAIILRYWMRSRVWTWRYTKRTKHDPPEPGDVGYPIEELEARC